MQLSFTCACHCALNSSPRRVLSAAENVNSFFLKWESWPLGLDLLYLWFWRECLYIFCVLISKETTIKQTKLDNKHKCFVSFVPIGICRETLRHRCFQSLIFLWFEEWIVNATGVGLSEKITFQCIWVLKWILFNSFSSLLYSSDWAQSGRHICSPHCAGKEKSQCKQQDSW